MEKPISVFLKDQAKDAYFELLKQEDKESRQLLKSLRRVVNILKTNPHYGNSIKKQLIPKHYRLRGIKNLFRVELSNFWRMLYTINGNDVEILVFVLNIIDHKDYNKLFGYKKH